MPMERDWHVDLTSGDAVSHSRASSSKSIPSPPGFVEKDLTPKQMQAPIRDKELVALKNKRAMDTALSPLKSIGMNAFMLYMGGKSIRIFSIMMVAMAFVNPIKAIMGTTQVFSKLDQEDQVRLDITVDMRLPKLIFILVNLGGVGMAVYKLATLGLLPITSADWMSYLPLKSPIEYTGCPIL